MDLKEWQVFVKTAIRSRADIELHKYQGGINEVFPEIMKHLMDKEVRSITVYPPLKIRDRR